MSAPLLEEDAVVDIAAEDLAIRNKGIVLRLRLRIDLVESVNVSMIWCHRYLLFIVLYPNVFMVLQKVRKESNPDGLANTFQWPAKEPRTVPTDCTVASQASDATCSISVFVSGVVLDSS